MIQIKRTLLKSRENLFGSTIAFDLDGTLVDSAADIIDHLNAALGTFTQEPLDLHLCRALAGQGARAMLDAAVSKNRIQLSSTELDAIFRKFVELYSAQPVKSTRVFPGVPEALHSLNEQGASLVVCTNKLTSIAEAVLSSVGVRNLLDGVFGYDVVSARKPSPAHLVEAIKHIGGDLSRTIMVGDSSADAHCAQQAGAPVILVSFGYSDVPHADLRPDYVIDHFDQLLTRCAQLLQPAR